MGTKQYLIVILSCMSLITSEMEHVFTFRTWIYLCITYSNSLLMALFMCFLLIYGGSLYLVDLMLPLLHTWPSLSNSGIFFTYTSPTTTTKVTLSLTFKNLFIYLFLERREGRKTGRETSMCERYIDLLHLSCLSHIPTWGPGLQPRHVPWLGIKRATLWFAACAQATEPLSHISQGWFFNYMSCIFLLVAIRTTIYSLNFWVS